MTPQQRTNAFWVNAPRSGWLAHCESEHERMVAEFKKNHLSHVVLTIDQAPLPLTRKPLVSVHVRVEAA